MNKEFQAIITNIKETTSEEIPIWDIGFRSFFTLQDKYSWKKTNSYELVHIGTNETVKEKDKL